MHRKKMDNSELSTLLQDHPSLEFIFDKTKVRCTLTKHEMPATVVAIQSYVNGKKYKKVRAEKCYDYDKLKPHIVSSTKKKHLHELFCTLTLRHIGKAPDDVERHLSGRKYKRALARWQKCKETGEKFVPRPGRQKKGLASDSDSVSGGDQFWLDDSGDDGEEDDMSDLYPAEEFKVDDPGELNGDCNEADSTEKTTEADDASDSDYSLSELDHNTTTDKDTQPKSSPIKSDNSTNSKPEKQGKEKQRKRQSSTEKNTVKKNKKKKLN